MVVEELKYCGDKSPMEKEFQEAMLAAITTGCENQGSVRRGGDVTFANLYSARLEELCAATARFIEDTNSTIKAGSEMDATKTSMTIDATIKVIEFHTSSAMPTSDSVTVALKGLKQLQPLVASRLGQNAVKPQLHAFSIREALPDFKDVSPLMDTLRQIVDTFAVHNTHAARPKVQAQRQGSKAQDPWPKAECSRVKVQDPRRGPKLKSKDPAPKAQGPSLMVQPPSPKSQWNESGFKPMIMYNRPYPFGSICMYQHICIYMRVCIYAYVVVDADDQASL